MHDILFENQQDWALLKDPTEKFGEYAKEIGLDVGKFADNNMFHIPSSVKDKELYSKLMKYIQNNYNYMIKKGETIENARGILPLNIYSPITMACTYRSLLGMIKQRLCIAAQEEWREVAQQIRNEMIKIHPVFGEPLDCMCERFSRGKGFCKTLKRGVTDKDIA